MIDEVNIRHLRVRGSEGMEPLQTRLRVEHLLGTAEFPPAGMPPNAILILRHVRMESGLTLEHVRLPRIWEEQLRSEISRQYRNAVRCRGGMFPPDADAILFENTGEQMGLLGHLLAQPATDLLWIWNASLGNASQYPDTHGLVRFWLNSPRYLPDALAHLESWGTQSKLLTALPDIHLTTLYVALREAFDLPADDPSNDSKVKHIQPEGRNERQSDGSESDQEGDRRFESVSRAPEAGRLPAWFTERAISWRSLRPVAQNLLTLAYAIRFATSRVNLIDTIRVIRAGRPEASVAQTSDANMQTAISPAAGSLSQTPRMQRGSAGAEPLEEASALIPPVSGEPVSRMQGDRLSSGNSANIASDAASTPAPFDDIQPEERSLRAQNGDAKWDGLVGIRSNLAGILYLINIALRTDAPDRFNSQINAQFDAQIDGQIADLSHADARAPVERPIKLSDHLTMWGLLDGLATMLLFPESETSESVRSAFAADPIWTLLAHLDSRSPGDPIAPNLPARASVLHSIFQYLSEDLARRLGGEPPERLLRVPGTIYVGTIHIDVVMPLDSIWMPARMAGLDASPGWLPECLRVVIFHFI